MGRKFFPVWILSFCVSACATEPAVVTKWSKPGGSQTEFVSIHDQCLRTVQARSQEFYLADTPYPGRHGLFDGLVIDVAADFGEPAPFQPMDPDMFHRCMNGHGWSVDPKGFTPPEGDAVAMGH